jgi:hypothetical protein
MPDKKENNEDKVNSGKDVNKKTDSSSHKDKPKTGSKDNISQKESKPVKKEGQKDKKPDDIKKVSSAPSKKITSKQVDKDTPKDAPIDEEKKSSDETDNKKNIGKKVEKANPDSNYQVSLVDENTLKIKIKTDKGVSLNSTVGGKNVLPDDVENLLNRLGSGKDGEIEIEISINPEKKISPTDNDGDKIKDEKTDDKEQNVSGVLIPNPEVADIINKKIPLEEEIQLTDEEILREKIGRKSPYNIYRRIYAQNFQIGLIAGVVIYLIAIFSFYSVASRDKVLDDEPQQRLIVLQDLPDPKIKLENIEDPNAPAKEEAEEDGTVPKRIPIKRNFNRPPTVKRPQNENKDTTNIKDTTGLADTNTVQDTSTASGNPIPDSLMTSYSGNEIGLIMNYPNNWKLVDSREINVNIEKFNGVVLSDTVAEKGTFNMFVKIDDENKPFDRDKYIHPFDMTDSNLTAFSSDPKELAGKMEYYFYILGTQHNLSVSAVITKDKFEIYKPSIEAVVRSISFAPKPQ